ncbi:hypothetical protein HY500_01295 [Candidatus Woesearchaeota archaeon]|nr:hypothetical protein [Candidatus Woesearchaeota archaeon]
MKESFIEIKIVKVEKGKDKGLNEDLQWISNSLGLFSTRDKEKSCFRIFLELIKAKKENRLISSDEIAFNSHLSRGTVIHHINKLIERDFIVEYKNRYALKSKNIESLIKSLESNLNLVLKDLKKVAKEIDKELKL